jgi:hypothetical protein
VRPGWRRIFRQSALRRNMSCPQVLSLFKPRPYTAHGRIGNVHSHAWTRSIPPASMMVLWVFSGPTCRVGLGSFGAEWAAALGGSGTVPAPLGPGRRRARGPPPLRVRVLGDSDARRRELPGRAAESDEGPGPAGPGGAPGSAERSMAVPLSSSVTGA